MVEALCDDIYVIQAKICMCAQNKHVQTRSRYVLSTGRAPSICSDELPPRFHVVYVHIYTHTNVSKYVYIYAYIYIYTHINYIYIYNRYVLWN